MDVIESPLPTVKISNPSSVTATTATPLPVSSFVVYLNTKTDSLQLCLHLIKLLNVPASPDKILGHHLGSVLR